MARRRFLPKYVSEFRGQHGKMRLRFRRAGYEGGYFTAELGTEAFREEYHAFMNPGTAKETPAVQRATPGTIGELRARYLDPITRLGPTKVTQDKVRAVIERFCDGKTDRMVKDVRFDHLDKLIAKTREKAIVETPRGPRAIGGIDAAKKLRKELIRFFAFAVKLGMRPDNPAAITEEVRVAAGERSTGYHTWTEEEIAQYREKHPLGTKQRLALELLLWSGQRSNDTRLFGRRNIKNGLIAVKAGKTGKTGFIPVSPQLDAAINAMPANASMFYLLTHKGLPYSQKGFGNFVKEACIDAGLPHCSAHGLRKAIMRRMADLNISNQGMKSVSFHSGDDEVALYTRDANQKRLADDAISALSAWELSHSGSGVRQKGA